MSAAVKICNNLNADLQKFFYCTTSCPALLVKDPSFVKNTFLGKVYPHQVFPYPSELSKEQNGRLADILKPVQDFLKEIDKPEKDQNALKFDENFFKHIINLGLTTLQIPLKLGGKGLSNREYARLSEDIGGTDLSFGFLLNVHQNLATQGIVMFGSKEQQEKYLPKAKESFAAFCLCEQCAGSDHHAIKSKAELSPDGSHYVLNGSKMWISNGGVADIMTVFAQTADTDKEKITAFIVEKQFEGVKTLPVSGTLDVGTGTTQVIYENVKVPKENVLGGVGNGFKVAMNILNNGRFGMAAALSGTMKTCIRKAVEFATKRHQFGQRIDTFGGVQEKIAKMSIMQYLTESMAYMIAGNMDKGSQHYHLEAAISKCFASEAAWLTCDETIQIMGGMGFVRDPALERVMSDLRIFRIFEGTNDILKLFIGLTGLQYAMGHFEDVQISLKNPKQSSSVMLEETKDRFSRLFGILYSNSLADYVHADLTKSAALLSKNMNLFASVVEIVLMKHGKKIANEQFIVNRVAQAAIDIYATAVILSRATKALEERSYTAHHEKIMAEVWTLEAYERIVKNLSEVTVPKHVKNQFKYSEISRNVCSNGGVVQMNPLNI